MKSAIMKSAIKTARGTYAEGYLVAGLLRGSWRKDPPPAEVDLETLTQILPLLTRGGVAGLVWRKIRGTSLATSEVGQELHQINRYDVLRNAVHARDLKEVLAILSARGIESVLVKGWSLGPLYPEPGVRQFGDIDLCVRPGDLEAARTALTARTGVDVDLHSGFGKFYESRTEELFSRSDTRDLDGTSVRVLRFEDHLRFLCLHLLRHGGNRPLWLCDIAAALESIERDFDWSLCLGGDARQAELVTGAIGIAGTLLDARIDDLSIAGSARRLPGWVVDTVLSEWSVPFGLPSQVATQLRHPIDLLRDLPKHWPNAIEATINRGGRLNDRPRWPLQIGDVITKTWGLLSGSRRMVRV